MVTTRPPKTIVKPTALGPVANTDTKLLIYGLFQKGLVLAQDEVKAKYPRAKMTTVIRKKEDRPEAADDGRSKTRNQRYIDSLRSTACATYWPQR